MAALTAAGSDRKKVTRKRRSSESDPKDGKVEGKEEERKEDDKSPLSSPVKGEEKGIMLSPTSVKPTFNMDIITLNKSRPCEEIVPQLSRCLLIVLLLSLLFYQETLKDEPVKEEKEEKQENECEENGDVEMKEEESSSKDDDDDNMDIEESEDQGSIQVGLGGGDAFGYGMNGAPTDIKVEDIPIAPAAPAPAQEDYEKVEVVFTDPNPKDVQGVLVYHRPENRKKKSKR
ncbi:hypothetical protein SK128_002436 [Halocaridina rubra]|uniref:Uncharacterized protein n=1 Tax=Halocaridina rubra TaxID=373956 RepID=A0AAN8XHG6_HALRR